MKKYIVRLTYEERKCCETIIDNLAGSSQKARRARILRQVDADGPNWTARQEAQLIALRLGPPPAGCANWSLRLLARRVMVLGIVTSISHETARHTLNRKDRIPGDKLQYWVIPPEQDAEFVAAMEEVLETYVQPYAAQQPVVCMDEQPVPLVRETRPSLAATAEHP